MPSFSRIAAPKVVINWSLGATEELVSFLMDEITFLHRCASTSGVETEQVGKGSFASACTFFHFFFLSGSFLQVDEAMPLKLVSFGKKGSNVDKAKILLVMLVCWAFAPQSTRPLQPPARCNCCGNPPEDKSSQRPKFAHLSHPSFSWQRQLMALLCGAFFDVFLASEIAARKTCTDVLYLQKAICLELCLQTKLLESHQRNIILRNI